MFCSDPLTVLAFLSLVSTIAVKDEIRIAPFMFDQVGQLLAVCPCCFFDRRVDVSSLSFLKNNDSWTSLFHKEKAKHHRLNFVLHEPLVEPGFNLRPVTEEKRLFRKVDSPVFRELGFRGYRFDKNVFFPVGCCKPDGKRLRFGIVNPDLMTEWPILQKAAAAWIFRLKEVPPIDFPDILPISSVGDYQFSEPLVSRNVFSWEKKPKVDLFYPSVFGRLNRKAAEPLPMASAF